MLRHNNTWLSVALATQNVHSVTSPTTPQKLFLALRPASTKPASGGLVFQPHVWALHPGSFLYADRTKPVGVLNSTVG